MAGDRESPWLVMRRCLALVQRLIRGPASGDELIAFVRTHVDAHAYSTNPSAARRAFKRDREHLQNDLGVQWRYEAAAGVYVLTSLGRLAFLDLPDDQIAALGLIFSTFEENESPLVPVRPLLDRITSLLPAERRELLMRQSQAFRVEMAELDTKPIPLAVWDRVAQATRQRRQLGFHYRSPRQADPRPRYWVVSPIKVGFYSGHWYLYCWSEWWRGPEGENHEPAYRRLRLQYIVDDDRLEVLPTRVAVEHRHPPRYQVHYLLKPDVGRGDISRHFEGMHVELQPDGSALVTGTCNDAWEAARILLSYGENCIVLGGEEVRAEMRRRVKGMAENYGFSSRSEGVDRPCGPGYLIQ